MTTGIETVRSQSADRDPDEMVKQAVDLMMAAQAIRAERARPVPYEGPCPAWCAGGHEPAQLGDQFHEGTIAESDAGSVQLIQWPSEGLVVRLELSDEPADSERTLSETADVLRAQLNLIDLGQRALELLGVR